MKRMLAVFVMLALPAAAQENRPHASANPGGGGGGTAHASPAPSSGTSSGGSSSGGSNSGGSTSSGNSGGGSVSAGSAGRDAGSHHAASGGSGIAVSRGGERAATRNDGSARAARTGDGSFAGGPSYARPHGNEPNVGTAVPRGSVPPASRPGGGSITTGSIGYYPWWWFGGYPDMQDAYPSGGGSSSVPNEEGTLKLKIKPKDAEVYVDGFFVGVVDDFDGLFQKLHVETGPHRIEVRAPGYEPLIFDVRITAEHGTTYQGELKRIK